jgi:hypothetical protein
LGGHPELAKDPNDSRRVTDVGILHFVQDDR